MEAGFTWPGAATLATLTVARPAASPASVCVDASNKAAAAASSSADCVSTGVSCVCRNCFEADSAPFAEPLPCHCNGYGGGGDSGGDGWLNCCTPPRAIWPTVTW